MKNVSLDIGGHTATFDLDLDAKTWQSEASPPEAEFPLIAEVDGKRYEIYSDGTLGEEELP